MTDHKHNFTYGGVVFSDSDRSLPGTGARARRYFDVYYCAGCLATEMNLLAGESDTYQPVMYGARPAPKSP